MSREKIIDAAVEVFAENGYHKTKMDDIAEAAGVAKGTLYYHFPSKAKLFRALAIEGQEMVINEVKSALNEQVPVYKQIKLIIEKNINLYLQYKELAKIFFNEISSGIDKEVLEEIQAVRESYIKFIADILEYGEKEGYIKKVNFKLAAAGIIGMLDGTCKYYLKNAESINVADITDSMFSIITSGIFTGERS